ncbi:MAG: hypothetical protein ONB49_21040, partial [candidate division KSB1 bacterium]|nr:hypothetical protein [candidate division KSB1 bacterium]
PKHPGGWRIKNFAGQRAVNSGRGARHTRHFFRTRASQHVKFRQRNRYSTFSVRVKHKQFAHENRNPTGTAMSWESTFVERSRDAFGKRANFEVRAAPPSKKVLLGFERYNWRRFVNTSFPPGNSKPACKIQVVARHET